MIIVTTDSGWPDRVRLEKDGAAMWLNRTQTQQAIDYLTHALATPPYPIGKIIKFYQLCERTTS